MSRIDRSRADPEKTHELNAALSAFSCIRCQSQWPIADYFEGCPRCLRAGKPSSLRAEYRRWPNELSAVGKRGMARYAAWLPYTSWVTLGEGGTPCTSFPSLAKELNAGSIFIKNEGLNPSGSHKDRATSLTVTRAIDVGATTIIAASSGNAGASLALYAAAGGIKCSIVTTPALSPIYRRAITMTGADIVTVPETLQRWRHVAEMVKDRGWFPVTNYLQPPVGSNHFGLDGLKTLAYELFEDLAAENLDAVLIPTSRGDLIWGLYEGFRQLKETGLLEAVPRLFAIEPFPRISRVLAGAEFTASFPGDTALVSINGFTVTYQAMEAIRGSGGGAVVVDERAVVRDQRRLAQHGCYVELSSAATVTGLTVLLDDDRIARDASVVLIATATGSRDLPQAWSAE